MLASRRQFISAVAASTGAVALPQIAASAEEDPFGGWPIGVQSFSLRAFNLVEAIRHIQGMGLQLCRVF